ncbi:shieldin complex subunit 1 isoform X3 [Ochotona curzoniae]|uniref:shieldin complex subunit 1 isoform X3 n=1 Tax=Ochotona curzoniae TaxID=130825 RepID=UPI001B35383B|nr:shieldin complex subunit 1 isoform X3 [Ochotona curzoniae]
MAAQEAAAGSLSPESCVLELPSTYDISHFVLQRPSQEPSSKALAPVEFQSFPCSSDVDPGQESGRVTDRDSAELLVINGCQGTSCPKLPR